VAAAVACGCAVTPSPNPSGVDCGPLAAADCAAATEVAKGALAADALPASLRVTSPTPDHSCPPSGGLAGSHSCVVIVVVSAADGTHEIGLLRTTSGGWIDASTIR
jgi:hypothetical protein